MSDDARVETAVAFRVDQATVNNAKNAYETIRKEIATTEKQAASIQGAFSNTAAFDRLAKDGKSAYQQIRKEIEKTKNAANGGFGGSQSDLRGLLDTGGSRQINVDASDAAKGLNLLGDALAAVGGEAGSTADQFLSTGANTLALIDGLSLLATTEVATEAAATGATGGLIGINVALLPMAAAAAAAAAAIAILYVGTKELSKGHKEMSDSLQNRIDQENNLRDLTRNLTSDDAKRRLAEIERDQEISNKALAVAKDRNDKMQAGVDKVGDNLSILAGPIGILDTALGTDVIGDGLFKVVDGLIGVGDSAEVVADEYQKQQDKATELADEHAMLTEALNSVEVAANDARIALLDSVDSEAELSRFRNKALENTSEQNAELAKQIEQERAIVQKQIDTLKASGNTSQEVQDEIKNLTANLSELDSQTQVLSSSAVKASEAQKAQSEAAEEAAEANKKAAEEQQKAIEKIADTNRKYTESVTDANRDLQRGIADAATNAAKASQEANTAFKDTFAETTRSFNDARLQSEIDYHEESQKAQRDNVRAIKNIIRDGTRSQEDALAERDFLSIDKSTKAAKRAIEDVAINAAAEKEERDIAAAQKLEDMQRNLVIERREEQIAFRQKMRDNMKNAREEIQALQTASVRKLQDLKTSLERELSLTAQSMQQKSKLEAEFWSQSIGRVQNALKQVGMGTGLTNVGGNVVNNVNTSISGSNLNSSQLENAMLNVMQRAGVTRR